MPPPRGLRWDPPPELMDMPQDLKIGLIIAVGIFLACGTKRISVKHEGAVASNEAVSLPIEPGHELPLPESPRIAARERYEEAQSELKKQAEQGSSKALAADFPKDLREKVDRAATTGSDDLPVLDLPDLSDEMPSEAKPKASPSPKQAKEPLPPVRSRDVVQPSKPSTTKSPSLDLPNDDWLSESGLKDGGKQASQLARQAEDDLPKLLPDADKFGSGPVHPYFRRFLKEGVYHVRDGDTLADIAHNLYQDDQMADKIVAANRDLFGAGKEVKAGMRLKLPSATP